jgi:hypothetical protein
MSPEKPIGVYQVDGIYLSHCSRKRAAQMVHRRKARWIGPDQVELLITNLEEKKIRRRVLERDGYLCYICETIIDPNADRFSDKELTYDHVIPRTHGGTDYEENLSVCCRECNRDKADRTPEQYTLYLYTKVLRLGGYKND